MRPLRVVVVMIDPPLPFGNAAGRWYDVLLRGLTERGHEVTAFAACPDQEGMDAARDLFPAPAHDLRVYRYPRRSAFHSKWRTLVRPYSYMFHPDLVRDINKSLSHGYDILHLEQLWSGWLGLGRADRSLVSVHYLRDLDREAGTSTQIRERWLERRAERRLLRAHRHFRACTPRLAEAILRVNPRAEVDAIPFGIDASRYDFVPDDRRTGEPVVSLIGSMTWAPSLSAANRLLTRLWPELKARVPNARLEIVGRDACKALKDHLGRPDVTIVENVPDTRPYFENASLLLYAPHQGSGIKVKVQEAMLHGLPVVTTSEGVEGLGARDGVHAWIRDDDQGLIDGAARLLTNPAEQNRLRHAARGLMESVCSPDSTVEATLKLHERIARAAGRER